MSELDVAHVLQPIVDVKGTHSWRGSLRCNNGSWSPGQHRSFAWRFHQILAAPVQSPSPKGFQPGSKYFGPQSARAHCSSTGAPRFSAQPWYTAQQSRPRPQDFGFGSEDERRGGLAPSPAGSTSSKEWLRNTVCQPLEG